MHVSTIEAAAKRKGARVVSAAGEGTDDDSPANQLLRMIVDAFAKYERLLIGARTSAALKAKAGRGERVSRHPPYGYRFTVDNRLERDDTEQAVVAIITECREAAFSLEGTARELNRLNHTTRSGKPWQWQYVRNVLQRQPAS